MEKSRALAALQALANDARLDLLRLLMPLGKQGMAAGEISRTLGLSASNLSFHLSALEAAGLITSRKLARNVFYAIDPEAIGGTISYLLNDCCMDHPEVLACCRKDVRATPELEIPAPDRSDQGS